MKSTFDLTDLFHFDLIVVGGGAAGFFAALSYCELSSASPRVLILEGQQSCLGKVKISGGGRCNITHNCMNPKELVKHYPRGSKELLGPFFHWGPREMLAWFSENGLDHKVESDGRIFPAKNTSQAVIDCFQSLIERYQIKVHTGEVVGSLQKTGDGFSVETAKGSYSASQVLLATGGSRGGHKLAQAFGHEVTPVFPSIFTFKVKDKELYALSGLSLQGVQVSVDAGRKPFTATGPVLVTHWGFSGPAVLRASAFAAESLAALRYKCAFRLDLLPDVGASELEQELIALQNKNAKKRMVAVTLEGVPKRFWAYLLLRAGFEQGAEWGRQPRAKLASLAQTLKRLEFDMAGRAVYKDEFVTGGGINNKEVDFRTMQSKLVGGLYFAGEILNVDGVTGGFNFQNAWTTGRLVGAALASFR